MMKNIDFFENLLVRESMRDCLDKAVTLKTSRATTTAVAFALFFFIISND